MKKVEKIISHILLINSISKNIKKYTNKKQYIYFYTKIPIEKIKKSILEIPKVSIVEKENCFVIEFNNCFIILHNYIVIKNKKQKK